MHRHHALTEVHITTEDIQSPIKSRNSISFVQIFGPAPNKKAPRFDVDDAEKAKTMIEHLEEYGYAFVSSVTSQKQIDQAKPQIWDFAENHSLA